MSFALPTPTTVVDKYLSTYNYNRNQQNYTTYNTTLYGRLEQTQSSLPTLWQIVSKYDSFRELTRIAQLNNIFEDPQANMTIFVPLDLIFPKTTLQYCSNNRVEEKSIIDIDFELARKMVNSVTIPSILSTTMMMQSAFTRYKTRDTINTLTAETPHCVQFEPETYTRPPFKIILNGKSKILIHDILASNGVVHTIDKFPYDL